MRKIFMLSVFALMTSSAQAVELQAKLVQLYQWKDGKPKIETVVAGLVNMDQVRDEPGANCGQFVGPILVEGVQFSESGATLESFRFTAANGAQWSVPTNIGKLSNVERSIANSFIRVGKKYFVHVQACGSGGFASLINMYDLTLRFKHKRTEYMSLSFAQIDTITAALISNAKELVFEGETLFRVGSFARSFALAHFAREELAKCMILHAAGTRLLAGVEVDWKKTMRRLRDHKAKLELEMITGALLVAGACQMDDEDRLSYVAAAAAYRNDQKNAALYVGLQEGGVKRPADAITEYQARRTIELAKFALEQQVGIFKLMGPFVDRIPGPIPGVSNVDTLTSEQLKSIFQNLAPIYQEIIRMAVTNSDKPD